MTENTLDQVSIDYLVTYFSKLVTWKYKDDAILDSRGKYNEYDKIYSISQDAVMYLRRAIKLVWMLVTFAYYYSITTDCLFLRRINDYEVKNKKLIGIFIAEKRLADSQLRPLMELCCNDD